MKWYDKLITVELAVLTLMLGVFFLFASIGFPWSVEQLQADAARLHNGGYAVCICFAGLFLIGISFRALYVWLFRKEKKIELLTAFQTELGSVCVSENALKTMITQKAKQRHEVVDCVTDIQGNEEHLSVKLHITARQGMTETAWMTELQNEIEAFANSFAGIKTHEVGIVVETINDNSAPARVQ